MARIHTQEKGLSKVEFKVAGLGTEHKVADVFIRHEKPKKVSMDRVLLPLRKGLTE